MPEAASSDASHKEPVAVAAASGFSEHLTPAQVAIIMQWVEVCNSLGLPKSLAQIYGLVFTSKRPVSAQDCVDALKISRSSAGLGLKTLRDIGAIRPAFALGSRRDAFVIEPDLGVLLKGLVQARIAPAIETFFTQVAPIEHTLDPEKDAFLVGRLQKLQRWHGKLSRIARWLLR